MESLLGEPPSDLSSGSTEKGKLSLLRALGLFLALSVLVFFIYAMGGISWDGITAGTMVCIIVVSLVPPLFLLIRYGKDFWAYVPAAIAICFSNRPNNLRHGMISETLGHLTLGIGLLALVVGTVLAAFFFPDPDKMKTLAVPAFWGAFLAMILCLFSLFQKHTFKLPQFPKLNQKEDIEMQGLGIRCFTFAKLSLGLILITIIWALGVFGIFTIVGELPDVNPFVFIHPEALFILCLMPALLLAIFPDDFLPYLSKAIPAFYRKQKPNLDFVRISRVGGKIALYGAILALSFPPIVWWPRIVSMTDWHTDTALWFPEGVICQSFGTFSIGLMIWALFRYLQYAFSEKK